MQEWVNAVFQAYFRMMEEHFELPVLPIKDD